MQNYLFLIATTFLIIVQAEAQAKEVRLHAEDGLPVSDYRARLASITPGDTIISGEERFDLSDEEIIRGSDVIARLRDSPDVIRLNGFYPPQGDDGVTQIIKGQLLLDWAEIPHNEVDVSRSRPGRYAIHRYYPALEALPDYLSRRARGQKNDRMDRALVAFAAKTSPFYFLGDFGVDQISFDGSKWRLMDWTNEHYLIEDRSQRHTWDPGDFIGNENLYRALEQTIFTNRAALPHPFSCLFAGAYAT